ncbi:hypothetical protein LDC_0005 [sediment metagenome]|uniref:Uncharacterized protein n=1 Tax=sediment metagenome TaxID=749907 RepID=D9PES7_9ZZZZ
MKSFDYLNKNSPKGSIVLSGEYASMMIPAFTNNFTILGREDSSYNYFSKKMEAFDFLNGKLDEKRSLEYLKKHNISYVIFGIDTIPYNSLPFKSWQSFEEIFREGNVVVVKKKDYL